MSADVAAPAPRKSRKIVKALMTLIGAAALVAGGFGAGFVYFANPLSPADDVLSLIEKTKSEAAGEDTESSEADSADGPQKVPKPVPAEEAFQITYFTFPENLTSNLSGSKKFLQIGVGVSTQYDSQVVTNIETHKIALQSDILAVMSTFTEEAIAGKEGRDALALAIRDAMNARLTELEGFGGIEGVFFPSFILQ